MRTFPFNHLPGIQTLHCLWLQNQDQWLLCMGNRHFCAWLAAHSHLPWESELNTFLPLSVCWSCSDLRGSRCCLESIAGNVLMGMRGGMRVGLGVGDGKALAAGWDRIERAEELGWKLRSFVLLLSTLNLMSGWFSYPFRRGGSSFSSGLRENSGYSLGTKKLGRWKGSQRSPGSALQPRAASGGKEAVAFVY